MDANILRYIDLESATINKRFLMYVKVWMLKLQQPTYYIPYNRMLIKISLKNMTGLQLRAVIQQSVVHRLYIM